MRNAHLTDRKRSIRQKTEEMEGEWEGVQRDTRSDNLARTSSLVSRDVGVASASDPTETQETTVAADAGYGSDSSSCDSSSSDSSSSSDLGVPSVDITDRFASRTNDMIQSHQSTPPQKSLVLSEDEFMEQWFGVVNNDEAEGIVTTDAVNLLPVDEDDDVFLLPSPPRAASDSHKRQLSDNELEEDPQEETTSSSEIDSDEERRHQEWIRSRRLEQRNRARAKRPRQNSSSSRRRPPPAQKYTTVPPEYSIFEGNVSNDVEVPILRGNYSWKGTHRVVFSGYWAFTEADFASNREERVSKFEYSAKLAKSYDYGSKHLPFSGKYTGYFNLRQFSGKILRVKEDQIELHFIRIPSEHDDSDDSEEETALHSKYEVIGRGKNRYGKFLVRGFHNPSLGRMVVRRKYLE